MTRHAKSSTWRSRRIEAKAAATAELAEAEQRLLDVRRAASQHERDVNPPPPPPDEAERRSGWTVLAAAVITVLTLGATMTMALVAISVQTGFFKAELPLQLQHVELLLFDWRIPIFQYAPLALEAGAWLCTFMVVVLVTSGKAYGRWHRAMWYIGITVAVINGWHTAEITQSLTIGLSFGAFSILGPFLVHLYVMFMRQLANGKKVAEAAADTINGVVALARALVRLVVALLRAVVAVLFHPVAVVRFANDWSAAPHMTVRDVWLAATAEHRERRQWRLRRIAARIAAGDAPPAMQLPAIRFRKTSAADETGTVRTAAQGVRDAVRTDVQPVEPSTPPRPDTPLSSAGDDRPHGQTIVTHADPDDRAHGTVHPERADTGGRAHAAPITADDVLAASNQLDDSARFADEFARLADQVGTDLRTPPVHEGVQDPVQAADQGTHGVHTPPADPAAQDPTTVNDQAGDTGAHTPPAVRTPDAQPRAHGSDDAAHGDDDTAVSTTESRKLGKDLVICEYWRLVRDGLPTAKDQVNVSQIARDLGVSRTRVTRVWDECLAGAHDAHPARRDVEAAGQGARPARGDRAA